MREENLRRNSASNATHAKALRRASGATVLSRVLLGTRCASAGIQGLARRLDVSARGSAMQFT